MVKPMLFLPILWTTKWVFNGKIEGTLSLTGFFFWFRSILTPFAFAFTSRSDRQPLGRQFVEISSATREQYYSAIARVSTSFPFI